MTIEEIKAAAVAEVGAVEEEIKWVGALEQDHSDMTIDGTKIGLRYMDLPGVFYANSPLYLRGSNWAICSARFNFSTLLSKNTGKELAEYLLTLQDEFFRKL